MDAAARIHCGARRRGGVADGGARAASGDASDWLRWLEVA